MQNSLGWQEAFKDFFLSFSSVFGKHFAKLERQSHIFPSATHQLFKAVRTQENKNQNQSHKYSLY